MKTGRLSVTLQAICEVLPLFDVPPAAFRPPPKVDSSVVRLLPRSPATVGIADPAQFERLVRDAFGQRRKTLRNALQAVCSAEQISAGGLRPELRAEQVAVAEFINLSNYLVANPVATELP